MIWFRKMLLITILFFTGYQAQSQVLISLILGDKINSDALEFGLEGGGNFSMFSGMDSRKFYPDWNIGFYFDYRIKEPWYFYTGVLVKSKMGLNKLTEKDLEFLGASTYAEDGTYKQVLRYFLLPFLIKHRFQNRFYAEAGIQVGWMFKSYVEFEQKDKESHALIKEFNKDLTNWFEIGSLVGAGYKFKDNKRPGMTVGLKYYRGFTNVYTGVSGTKNNSIFLKVNIPIGAGEQARKKREEKAREKAEKKKAKEKQ